MNWSQIESKMKWLWGYIKKLLNVLYKAGCGISYAWFLFPVVFWFSYVKTWQYMNSDPHTTDLYLGINLLAGLLHVIATLFLLHRRRAVQFSISAIMWSISLLPFYVLSICLQSAPTGYAAEHPIPKGLACHTPMAEHADMEKAVNPEDSTTYLQIRKGIQGGIYEYSFFYPQLPEGTIWLQCYEAGKNVPLSKREIKKKTSQKTKATSHFSCLAENKEFTIYEGDWSEYYAARIEVWFKDKKGNKRKLQEKFYTVEGWSR